MVKVTSTHGLERAVGFFQVHMVREDITVKDIAGTKAQSQERAEGIRRTSLQFGQSTRGGGVGGGTEKIGQGFVVFEYHIQEFGLDLLGSGQALQAFYSGSFWRRVIVLPAGDSAALSELKDTALCPSGYTKMTLKTRQQMTSKYIKSIPRVYDICTTGTYIYVPVYIRQKMSS